MNHAISDGMWLQRIGGGRWRSFAIQGSGPVGASFLPLDFGWSAWVYYLIIIQHLIDQVPSQENHRSGRHIRAHLGGT